MRNKGLQGALGGQLGRGATGGDTSGTTPARASLPPAAASLPGMGSKALSASWQERASRGLGPSCSPGWQSQSPGAVLPSAYEDTGGTCEVSLMVRPPFIVQRFFDGWILEGGAGVTPSRAEGCPVSSHFLPNTQGPRGAFKIPFITMEPSRLKSQAKGLELVSGVATWGRGFGIGFFFFALSFLFKQKWKVKWQRGEGSCPLPPSELGQTPLVSSRTLQCLEASGHWGSLHPA